MNPLINVGTLPACQRLQAAGIVLETEAYWNYRDLCSPDDIAFGAYGEWELSNTKFKYGDICVPAPSMAEVWRKLPFQTYIKMLDNGSSLVWICDEEKSLEKEYWNANPTDSLIDLLIWVTKQKKEK